MNFDARVEIAEHDLIARAALISELMERLVGTPFLRKLDAAHAFDAGDLSEEERQAHRFSSVLHQLGWQASPVVIRGTDRSPESRSFLHKLAAAVKVKEKATDPNDPKPPLTPATYLPLVDFICTNFSSLVGEGPQLLPSDIVRASLFALSSTGPTLPSPSYAAVDELLSTSGEKAKALSDKADPLRQRLRSLARSRPSLSPPPPPNLASISISPPPPPNLASISKPDSDEDWATEHSRLVSSMSSFLSTASAFSSIYSKDLGVWCESLPPAPPTSKDRLGERSSQALVALKRSRSLLLDLSAIRRAHEALSLSRPPLEGFEPRALERIATEARRRAVELERQANLLERSAACL